MNVLSTSLCVTAFILSFNCDQIAYSEDAKNTRQTTPEHVKRFDNTIAQLLSRHCLDCHNATDKKGGLDLSQRAGMQRGGDSGSAIVAGRLDQSLLWQRVTANEMPPKEQLTAAEKIQLSTWIKAGAPWGTDPIDPFRVTTSRRAGYDWWSLQPLQNSEVPTMDGDGSEWVANPIDAYVLKKLTDEGLHPSTMADQRTQIRRLTFDLIGLPPTRGEVQSYLADDSPAAYERLVDRLLTSPHYGERWARHWLDIVRFGESAGFERDKMRPNAWRYRDWVVNALNGDMPYNEFASSQLAGDVINPQSAASTVATGFLVAGPYDEVGQNQQSAAMRAVVRQDELEDIVSAVGQTFLGLTINCARCHDHKFDPVRQEEYYRLTAALAGVRHGEREITNAHPSDVTQALQSRIDELIQRNRRLEQAVRRKILATRRDRPQPKVTLPEPIARWDFEGDLKDSMGKLHGKIYGNAVLKNGRLVTDGKTGYVATAPIDRNITARTLEAWVQLRNLDQRGGGVVSLQSLNGSQFDAIVFGERQPRRWMAGSNVFKRTQPFGGVDETKAHERIVHVAIVYQADGQIIGYRNGRPYGKPYKSSGPVRFESEQAQLLFGLRHEPTGGNRLLAAEIDKVQLYDQALTAAQVAASAGVAADAVSDDEILAHLKPLERKRRQERLFEIAHLEQQRDRGQTTRSYVVVPRKPEPAFLLKRGNTTQRGPQVTPGGVAAVKGTNANFDLDAKSSDGQRRIALGRWIASRDNPLFARVIVNRLWHYHFGIGLVETPSDLGFNGGRPSHPQLIDYLANELIRSNWSLKAVQRAIVLSATYRQSSRFDAASAKVDAGNRLLWRKSPVRLEAEVLRDTILAISGELNRSMIGPGYQDFKTFHRNTQFYETVDPVGHSFHRRSLYRTWIRSGRNPFLDAFDCPDPSTKTPRRAVTTTPLQALALLNNSFVLRMADRLAGRLQQEAGGDSKRQLDLAFSLAYSRPITKPERQLATIFVKQHGLPAFCRVLFNSNEFLHVD